MRCPSLEMLPLPPHMKTGWAWTEEGPQLPDTMPDGSPWPKVSIITPSLNQGEFIEETIRSVLLQGYPNLEYIIMDGGSSDETVDIIRKYETWITHWVSESDRGQSDAINKGFAKSTGEIMAWLNSDDTYTANALACVAWYFMDHADCNILYGEAWHVDENGGRLRPCRYVTETISKSYILNVDPIVQPATFWRRSLWLNIGELDSSLRWGFDWEFLIRAYLDSKPHYVPEFLANYRLQDDMKSKTGGQARHSELAKITRCYGGWWQPTNLLYQAVRPRYLVRKLTSEWPGWIRKPLDLAFSIPWSILSRLYVGKFMW